MNKLKRWINRLKIKFLKMEFLPLEELTLMRLMSDDNFVASDSLESIMELEKIENIRFLGLVPFTSLDKDIKGFEMLPNKYFAKIFISKEMFVGSNNQSLDMIRTHNYYLKTYVHFRNKSEWIVENVTLSRLAGDLSSLLLKVNQLKKNGITVRLTSPQYSSIIKYSFFDSETGMEIF